RRGAGAQVGAPEGIGVQAAAIDLHPQHLLQAHVAELHGGPEMIDQRELAGLVRSLEQQLLESERLGEVIGLARIELARSGEQPNVRCALASLNLQAHRARLEPSLASLDQL